ncbi:type II toxin-antitoxin system HicB family antitoxin [Candidatus Azambacteria bacterium]|nr:type II toxin-antitoxin system HicB family antitoxin [Candidatus Azambacteria bacterium]
MKHIVQFNISKGEKYYIAEGVNFPAVTEGKTLDELVKNVKEAVELGLEGENPADFGLASAPSVLVNFELETNYAHA